MFKLLGYAIKILLFSLVVIVLSNWMQWRGRTISDQVRVGLAHAEHSPWVEKLPTELKDWVAKKSLRHAPVHGRRPLNGNEASALQPSGALRPQAALASENTAAAGESIPASEQQKLKALIRELNGSHGRD